MTTTRQYVYKVTSMLKDTDGDTYWLYLDTGFYDSSLREIRLLGYDTPELRKGTAYERAQGKEAAHLAQTWLQAALDTPGLTLWVRTEKDPDDFGRWLGEVWSEYTDGTTQHLGEYLRDHQLASIWPQRWHEEFDPTWTKGMPRE